MDWFFPGAGCTVLLANGDFPRHPVPLTILRRAGFLICCDGAAANLPAGIEPDAVVGDGDSLPAAWKERWGSRWVPVAEQETNDLSKAFRYAIAHGAKALAVLGAGGKRDDHALGNYSLLADFAAALPATRLYTDFGCFAALTAPGGFDVDPGQPVSIFSFDPRQAITARGLEYPLEGLRLSRWWQATLNRAAAPRIEFDFDPSSPLLCYFPYPEELAK